MHILLVRFSSMGDVVLQTATINWLRSLLGHTLTISFVTSQEFVSLLENHPEVNHVIGFNRRGETWKDLKHKIHSLHREKPIDLIFDLHATLRSFRLRCSFWTIPALTVDKRRWERFFLTKIKSVTLRRWMNNQFFGLGPQVERIIKDFESIFGDSRGRCRTEELRNGPHQELTSLAELPLYQLPRPYIVIAPSASYYYKRWPVQSFVELTQKLLEATTFHYVILAGPDDSFCDAFKVIESDRLHYLQGKTTLKESMSILEQSILCVGNDSGMNHIAEAYGVPCVTLFGPTDPLFGFAPHGASSVTISKELWCKPCSTTGKKACFRDRHYCMENITVDEVKDEVLKVAVIA